MKYINTLSIILGVTLLTSCVKHEVIPAPTYESSLPISFKGKVDSANFEIIEDIKGFYCETEQAKETLPSPEPSTITYYTSLKSGDVSDMIQLRMGKLRYSVNTSSKPTVDQFNEFFLDDLPQPVEIKDDAEDGVVIVYRDSQGKVWKSSETTTLPQTFEISDLETDSDDNGEYMKFVARFSLSLFDDLVDPVASDTIEINDATFVGYFKR